MQCIAVIMQSWRKHQKNVDIVVSFQAKRLHSGGPLYLSWIRTKTTFWFSGSLFVHCSCCTGLRKCSHVTWYSWLRGNTHIPEAWITALHLNKAVTYARRWHKQLKSYQEHLWIEAWGWSSKEDIVKRVFFVHIVKVNGVQNNTTMSFMTKTSNLLLCFTGERGSW